MYWNVRLPERWRAAFDRSREVCPVRAAAVEDAPAARANGRPRGSTIDSATGRNRACQVSLFWKTRTRDAELDVLPRRRRGSRQTAERSVEARVAPQLGLNSARPLIAAYSKGAPPRAETTAHARQRSRPVASARTLAPRGRGRPSAPSPRGGGPRAASRARRSRRLRPGGQFAARRTVGSGAALRPSSTAACIGTEARPLRSMNTATPSSATVRSPTSMTLRLTGSAADLP